MSETINFDRRKLARLRAAKDKAAAAGEAEFMFDGHRFLVSYARYLIEFLESQFARIGR